MKKFKINLIELLLFVYIFSISFFSIGSYPLKFVKLCFCLLTIFFIIKKRIFLMIKNKYILYILLFTLFSFLSIFWAYNKDYAMTMSITLLLNSVCLILVMYLILENKKIKNISLWDSLVPILYGIIFGSIFMGLNVFIQNGPFVFIKNSIRGIDNVSANVLGMNCAIASIILITMNHYEKKIFYKFLLVLSVMFTFLSASRKSLIFLGIPILFTLIFTSKDIGKIIIRIFISCIVVFISYLCIMKVNFLYDGVGHRVESMIQAFNGTGGDSSARTRNMMIQRGIKWFANEPIKGYGMNNYSYLFGINVDSIWGKKGVYAHNNFVELLVDIGLIGTILYYSMHLSIILNWIKKIKNRNYHSIVFVGILLSIILTDYGMVSYFNILTQLLILLCWLLICSDYEVIVKERRDE